MKLLCPVADIVWPAVCTVLQEKLVSLFDAGIPEAFRRKYLAASALEQAVADLCATPEEVNQLRRSAVSRVWRSKWNVDIYAAECVMTSTRELNLLTESWKRAMMLVIGIGAPVNTAAARKRESPGRPGEGSSSVAASASPSDSGQSGELTAAHRISAFNALQSLWVALRRDVLERFFTEMYLPPATLALLRHCLLSSKSVAGRVTQVLADVFRSLSTFTASGEAYTAMEVAVLTLALSGMEDICLLGEYITSSGLQRIEQTTATATIASPALSATLQQACRFTSERLRQEEYTAIRSMVYEHVERHITPPLQHIKSVRSFFSHTQRSMPDAPSWYVETILTPIRALARAFQAYQQQQQETSTSLSLSTSSTSSASPSTRVKPMSKVTVWGVCQQMSTTTTTTNTNFKSGDASDPSYGLVSMSTPSLQMMRVAQASFTADYCALVLRIATTVFTRFTELARETLGAAKKAEEGWEKLRRKREAAAAAAAAAAGGAGGPAGEMNQATAAAGASRRRVTAENATDIDKMILQLYLDANELLQQLRALLPSGAVDSLEKEQIVVDLHTLLRRGQWISGAAIEEPPELDF